MAQALAEKLEHTGPAEKERVASLPQRKQLARTPKPLLLRGKETEPSVKVPDREVRERVKASESRSLAREKGIRAGAWRGKSELHSEGRQVSRRRGRASKKSIPRRRRKNMRG